MISLKEFVEKNQTDLRNMFDILKNRFEITLSFKSFCKFCYENSM